MGEGSGHSPPPPPPQPPPPPPPPVVLEVKDIAGYSVDGTVVSLARVSTHARRNPDAVGDAPPSSEVVLGQCDRCGATGTSLAAWRVQLATPPAATLHGVCVACEAAADRPALPYD